ncbi:hypothetical protein HOV93_06630 [Planctomycetes bacterium FF15]|uniref:Uncharacterized protein n=1 Tax=Bremerella alba TaxID=980252 RepID=A0A7V8V2M8_9BACT|nr:hypothetical protein [Bremerella alba]
MEKVLVSCARMSTASRFSMPEETTDAASELVDGQLTGKQRPSARFFTQLSTSFTPKMPERNAPRTLLIDSSKGRLTTTTLSKYY